MDASWEEAIKREDVAAMRKLLDSGTDINARNQFGQTGLMIAAHMGLPQTVQFLISQKPDLNVTAKFGLSALMLAIVAGHTSIALMIAAAGADLSKKGSGAPGFINKTAYDLAIASGMTELAGKIRAQ